MRAMPKGRLLPVFWLIVACPTLVGWEYDGPGRMMSFNGFGLGVLLSIVLYIVLAARIFRRVEDILISRGRFTGRLSTPYDIFPLLLLIPFGIGYSWLGDRWAFEWGTQPYKWAIYLAILGLVLGYRINSCWPLPATTRQPLRLARLTALHDCRSGVLRQRPGIGRSDKDGPGRGSALADRRSAARVLVMSRA